MSSTSLFNAFISSKGGGLLLIEQTFYDYVAIVNSYIFNGILDL